MLNQFKSHEQEQQRPRNYSPTKAGQRVVWKIRACTVDNENIYKLRPCPVIRISKSPSITKQQLTRFLLFCFVPENGTEFGSNFSNSNTAPCKNATRSIDDFPPDFFTDDQRRHGAVAFHFLVAFYGFVFIAFVCNDYFLPSVFCICLGMV